MEQGRLCLSSQKPPSPPPLTFDPLGQLKVRIVVVSVVDVNKRGGENPADRGLDPEPVLEVTRWSRTFCPSAGTGEREHPVCDS